MPRTTPTAAGRLRLLPEYLGRLGQLGRPDRRRHAGDRRGDRGAQPRRSPTISANVPGGGLNFVDTYALVAERDDKHFRDQKPIWVHNWRLNNVPLQGFSHKGGLYGLDNLHPTTVGYAALAQAVCEEIVAVEGIKPLQPIEFEAAFDSDSLLTNIPRLLDIDNLLIDLVVAFIRFAARPSV
jgi:hypothetical protein